MSITTPKFIPTKNTHSGILAHQFAIRLHPLDGTAARFTFSCIDGALHGPRLIHGEVCVGETLVPVSFSMDEVSDAKLRDAIMDYKGIIPFEEATESQRDFAMKHVLAK